jgi:hypothetical protein
VFSRASRNISKRMDRMVRGRPRPRAALAAAVPAQDGVRADQQHKMADQQHKMPESVRRKVVKQPSEKELISRRERGLGHLPLQHHQLVP